MSVYLYNLPPESVTPLIEREMGKLMEKQAEKERGGRKILWSKLHGSANNTTPRSPYLMALHANAPTRNEVIRVMAAGAISRTGISEATGLNYHSVKSAIDNMMRIELCEKLDKVDRHFVYRLTDLGRQFIKDLDQKK